MKIVVTYDVVDDDVYERFYNFAKRYKARQLTESSYEFNIKEGITVFANKIGQVFDAKDKVYLIYSSPNYGLISYKI